jgi:hypothetical protein
MSETTKIGDIKANIELIQDKVNKSEAILECLSEEVELKVNETLLVEVLFDYIRESKKLSSVLWKQLLEVAKTIETVKSVV